MTPREYLRAAAVRAIFRPGTHLIEAAGEVLNWFGPTVPPIEEAAT
jgi:methylmalonyl-CoA mutase